MTKEEHAQICSHEWYSFLRWECQDILNLLENGQISQAKAVESVIGRKLGHEVKLPELKVIL